MPPPLDKVSVSKLPSPPTIPLSPPPQDAAKTIPVTNERNHSLIGNLLA
jgi:hypothetical protein